MSTKYMRGGKDFQYLHRAGCKRYRIWHHALGTVVRWQWADRASRADLLMVVRLMGLRICRSCAPLGDRRQVRSPR
jgi:hypothetical protein